MCFSLLKEKNGRIFPLPDAAGDVISLMKAFDILDNKFKTIIGFLNDEKIEKIDSFYKIYYPIYIVKTEGATLCIDALNLQKTKIINFIDSKGCDQKAYEGAILTVKDLSYWEFAAFEGEIDDGFAIPCILKKEDAIVIAKEVLMIYESLKEKIENLREEEIREEENFKRNIQSIKGEINRLEKEFEEKINEKRRRVERLLSTYEKEETKKIHEYYKEQRKLLENKKREFEELFKCLQKELMEIDEEKAKLSEDLNDLRKKIFNLNKKREKITVENKDEFNEVKKILEDLEKSNISIRDLKALEEEKVKELDDLDKKRERIKNKIEEVEKIISGLTDDIKSLPIKEELECRKAKEEFLKSRKNIIDELNLLLKERKEKLCEYYIKEEIIKFEFNLIKNRIRESLHLLEDNKRELEKYISLASGNAKDEVDLLYIPYYLILKENDVRIIEPIIVLKGGGKVEYRRLGLDIEIVKFALIKNLPLLISEAKGIFNLLSKKNRDRILQGMSILKSKRMINRIQESILLRQIEV